MATTMASTRLTPSTTVYHMANSASSDSRPARPSVRVHVHSRVDVSALRRGGQVNTRGVVCQPAGSEGVYTRHTSGPRHVATCMM